MAMHGPDHFFCRKILFWLTRRVNFTNDDFICLAERGNEIVKQRLCARIGMWLPDGPDAPGRVTGACRIQRGADFGWVMGVIVDDDDALGLAFDFKAPCCALELAQ